MMNWLFRPSRQGLRRVTHSDRSGLERFFAARPVDSVLARVALEEIGVGGSRAQLIEESGDVTGFLWDYGNVIPLGFSRDELDDVAADLLSRWRTASSLVGPQDQVLGLWRRLSSEWGPARSVRECQYSMVLRGEARSAPDPFVRPAEPADFDVVFPASVAMYTEEVGYDPTAHGDAYAKRVKRLVSAGHTFIRTAPSLDGQGDRVIFKADIGALAGGVAQLQGVWVAPDQRGRGIACAGVAAAAAMIHRSIAPTVSLYVNDYNQAAVAVYRKIGFAVDNLWSTVLI